MTMLPDVDQDSYTDYQRDEFQRQAKQTQDRFSFLQSASDKIAQVGGQVGGFAHSLGEGIQQANAPPLAGTGVDQARAGFEQSLQAPPTAEAAPAQSPQDQLAQLQQAISANMPDLQSQLGQPVAPSPQAAPATDQRADQLAQLQQAISDLQPDIQSQIGQGQTQDRLGQLRQAIAANMPNMPDLRGQLGQPSAAVQAPPAERGGDLRDYARGAAARAGIDPDVFVAQINQESGFNPNAGSPAGAQGVAQIMPQTAAGWGVDPHDPYASLDAAATNMARYQQRYGGDMSKALAAYNAGPGAVDTYGGVPPYEETQRYVKNILGAAGQAAGKVGGAIGGAIGAAGRAVTGAFNDISQFGDPQLSTDEAYSACGPAAAVRFAERFGRNPTLREAVDLAKSVGWTSGQGMAGIASEQQLLNKMGVDTTLIQGPQWDRIAQEASTGNPVTISTQGHYFYADGYNPQTGAFHVGRSGTDLRQGSEWMTPDQMTGVMGPVQGALLANSPVVPQDSTAQPARGAGDVFNSAIGSVQGALAQPLAEVMNVSDIAQARGRQWLDEQTRNLDRAVTDAVSPTAQQTQAATRQPDFLGPGGPPLPGLDQTGEQAYTSIRRAQALPGLISGEPDLAALPGQVAAAAPQIAQAIADYSPTVQAALTSSLPPEQRPLLSEDTRRQLAGEEPTKLGPLPISIPGQVGGEFGALSDVLKQVSPLTHLARVEEGTSGVLRRDPVFSQTLSALANASTPEEALQLNAQLAARREQLMAGMTLPKAYAEGLASPDRETAEDLANMAGGLLAMGIAPEGLASGVPRLAASLAVDPSSAPFVGGTELLGRGVRAVGEALGLGRRAQPGLASNIIEDAIGREVPTAPVPHLEQNISGTVGDAVNRALGQQLSPEEIADAARTLAEAPTTYGKAALNPFTTAQTPEGLARIRNQLGALADMGADQRHWYEHSSQQIMDAAQGNKDDAEKIAQLVAIFSNRTPVNDNMNRALTAWSQYKAGVPIDVPGMTGPTQRAKELLLGGKDWEGAKTNNFYRNLMKHIDEDKYLELGKETGQSGVTVDIWMLRALNSLRNTPSPGTGQYEFAANEINRIAKARGWTPEQAQAAIWVATKAGWENAARKVPMDLSREGIYTYGTALQERLGRMAGAAGGDIARVVQDENGVDTVARDLGLLGADGRLFLPAARKSREGVELPEAIGAVEPSARQAINVYTAGVAKALRLPEAWWAREFDPRSLQEANGLAVDAGRALTSEEAAQLQDHLDNLIGVGGGKVMPTDNGAWIINRTDAPNRAFHKAGEKALGALESVDEVTAAPRRFDAEFFSNDWSKQPNGEGYLDSIRRAGGSAAERWQAIEDRLAGQLPDGGDLAGRAAANLPAAAEGGARASLLEQATAPLRTSLGRGAIGGGVAGGYQAAQEPGATPQDIAKGILGGAALGATRAGLGRALGPRALRELGPLARIAEEVGSAAPEERSGPRRLEPLGGRVSVPGEEGAAAGTPIYGPGGEVIGNVPRAEGAPRVTERAVPGERPSGPPPTGRLRADAESNIRIAKYVPEEVRDVIQTTWDAHPDLMDQARRGVVGDDVVRDLADRAGLTIHQVQNMWRPGQAKNAETILALRQSLADQGQRVVQAQRALVEAPDSLDAKLQLTKEFTRMQAVQEVVAGVTAEAGRALRQFNQPLEGQNAMLVRLMKMAKAKQMSTDDLAAMLGKVDLSDPKALGQLARDMNPASKWDKFFAYLYFNMLSNPLTHIRNITSNVVTAGMTPAESLGAGLMDLPSRGLYRLAGGKDQGQQRFLGESLADVVGMGTSLPSSMSEALRGLTKGPEAEALLSGQRRAPAFEGVPGAVIGAPGRALAAEDAFFSTLNQNAALHRLAYRKAMQEGDGSVADTVRRMSEMLHNPDEQMLQQAIEQGKYRTFNGDSGLSNALLRLRSDVPALRYILPFVRTPTNIAKYTLERSPLGYLGILGDMAFNRERLVARGSGDLADRLSRATIGSLIMGGIANMGEDNLTGKAPDDPTERDAFYRQGKQPYSFRSPLDGNWYSYQALQPYSPLFAAVGNMKQTIRANPNKTQDVASLGLAGAIAAGQSLIDMPWTQGLADVLDLMSGKGSAGRDPQKMASDYIGRQASSLIPAASAMRGLARFQDATIRDPSNPLEAMMANVPYLQERVPERLDAFGNAVQRPTSGLQALLNPFSPSEANRDPVETELAHLQDRGYQVEPGFVGKSVTMLKSPVELTPEQHREYQRNAGQMGYAMLQMIVGSDEWKAMNDDQKALIVDRVLSRTRDVARKAQEPELFDQAVESLSRRMERTAGGEPH